MLDCVLNRTARVGGQDFRQMKVDSTADPAALAQIELPLLRIAPIDLQCEPRRKGSHMR